MKRRRVIYEGKAKILYTTEDPDLPSYIFSNFCMRSYLIPAILKILSR